MKTDPRPLSTLGTAEPFAGIRILICGATGNLGGELAKRLARHGNHLLLWGRCSAKLQEIALICREQGAQVITRSIDLVDIEAAVEALREDDNFQPIDCVFFASGSGETREAGRKLESPSLITRLGVLNYVAPSALTAEIGARMAERGRGKIAIVSTAAAAHPLPFAAAYSSSKSGLSHFAEAMRIALKPHGVSVTLVSPGFFAPSEGNAYSYSRPGETTSALVAERMIDAVARNRAHLVTPGFFRLLGWLGAILPRWVRDRLLLKLPSP